MATKPVIWSYKDCYTTISSEYMPNIEAIEGTGSDTITFDKGQGRATMQKAADGHIVFSNIAGEEGTVTIESQQTSPLHKHLQKMYNISRQEGNRKKMATIMIDSINNITGERVTCSYGIFVGEPADARGREAQNRSWQILFADITFEEA